MIRFDNFIPQYQLIREEIAEAIQRVLESGWFILGEEVRAFEKEFAEYIGSTYAVGVASGTEAIALSLMALGIGPNDEVITTSLTAFPTVTGIMQSGARPVLVDVRPETGLLDPREIEKKITKRTRAILPVHLYGQSCSMETILEVASAHGLKIIEDCAQSCGATWKRKKTGSWGDCGAFSFYPTKNLGAYGDGGAVTTQDPQIDHNLRRLRNYGQNGRYNHEVFGINSRLDEMQAAILRVKLRHLDDWNRQRLKMAGRYRQELRSVSFFSEDPSGVPVYHLFVIQSSSREALISRLQEHGIQTHIHYPLPVNGQKAFPYQKEERFPVCETLTSSLLSIPLYPELGENNQGKIIEVINGFKA